MRNKFLRTSGVLGMIILSGIPAKSVQRFAMNENEIYITTSDGRIKMPTRIGNLVWRGVEYEPAPNRRAKGWLEWNVAPDGQIGPAPIYGEKITIKTSTNSNKRTCCFCFSWIETGHPTRVDFTTKLLLSGPSNPECVVLYWNRQANGLAAIRKEDLGKRNKDELTPPLKSAGLNNVQKEIKAVEKLVERLPQEEINTRSFQIDLRAAEQGDMQSQVRLAHCYHVGNGVTKDPTKAVYWYRKAAEQGDEGAKKILLSRYKITIRKEDLGKRNKDELTPLLKNTVEKL